ncbi:MAG: tetratricopeptide repeat protein, partial [Candidatus Methylomirabilales bacterium]
MRSERPAILFARGEKERRAGMFTQALASYRDAVPLFRRSGDPQGLFQCLLAQGHCLRLLGNFREAQGTYQKALAVAATLKSPTDRADAEVG